MVKLTFLIKESAIEYVGDWILETAPENKELKKEVVKMVIEELLKGEDESFLTIEPKYTPSIKVETHTVKEIALAAIIHKATEIVYKNYQPIDKDQ